MAVRTAGDPLQVASAAQQVLWSIDPELPVPGGPLTMDDLLDRLTAWDRMFRDGLAAFAALGLLLAAMGVYGMLSLGTARRTFEMGVRVCCGATMRDVLWLLARDGLVAVGLGLLAGTGILVLALPALEAAGAGRLPIDATWAWSALPPSPPSAR